MVKIVPTEEEQKIFDFLLEVNSAMNLGTVMRVAGGWVRDKLLGIPSDDIDIALSNMTGSQFEEKVSEYSRLYQQKTGSPHPALGKSYTVKANPEKSKLLETVAVEVYGNKIDFVNLREEKYDEKSRIPVMAMATGPDAAKKDSERRDLTINGLFYNINTAQVEDYVGGIKDLQSMTLRTPLDPEQTFKDDPLRMLRVLRFFSRYPTSTIDPKIIEAMQNPVVQNMYANLSEATDPTKKNYKVAPERAWPELKKMMEGSKPGEALRLMFDTGLHRAVFNTPKFRELMDLKMDQQNPNHAHNLLDHTFHVMDNLNKVMGREGVDKETRMLMNFASLFHDFGKAHPDIRKEHPKKPGQMQYMGHEDKGVEIADEILKTIGMGRRARNLVNQVIEHHMRPHSWPAAPQGLSGVPADNDSKDAEKYYGRFHDFLSKMKPIEKGDGKENEIPNRSYTKGNIGELVIMHSLADSAGKDVRNMDREDIAQKMRHMDYYRNYARHWGSLRPVVNGNDLMTMFPALNPATKVEGMSFISDIMDKVNRRQAIGKIKTKEDAVVYIEGMRRGIEDRYGKKPQQPPLPQGPK